MGFLFISKATAQGQKNIKKKKTRKEKSKKEQREDS